LHFGIIVGDSASPGVDAGIASALSGGGHTSAYIDDDDSAPSPGTFAALIHGLTAATAKTDPTYGGDSHPQMFVRGATAINLGLCSAATTESTTTLTITFGEHASMNAANGGSAVLNSAVNFATIVAANLATGVVPLATAAATAEIAQCAIEPGGALISGTAPSRRLFVGWMNGNGTFNAASNALIVAGAVWCGNAPTLVDTSVVKVEYTVGATGRHFAVLHDGGAADAATTRILAHNADLVAQNIQLHLTPYADAPLDEAPVLLNGDGWTTDATRRLVIEPIGANRYLGTPGSGVVWAYTGTPAAGEDLFFCNIPYTEAGYFEVDGSSVTFSGDPANDTSSGCKWNSAHCRVHDIYSHDIFISNRNRGFSSNLGVDRRFWNIEVGTVQRGTNSGNDCSGIRLNSQTGDDVELYNATVRGSEDMGCEVSMATGATATVRNVTSTDNAGVDFFVGASGTYDIDYCTSEDGTAVGANSDTSVTPADEFESATADTADYFTLKATAVGRATGEDVSGTYPEIAIDITGATRPSGAWDRTARQGTALVVGQGPLIGGLRNHLVRAA
jgi:hypothetical protein